MFNRNYYHICLGNYEVKVALVEEGESRFKAESSAMKVDQNGKLLTLRMVFGEFWKIKTTGD